MYKLLREILSELKSINKKLQVIASDEEQRIYGNKFEPVGGGKPLPLRNSNGGRPSFNLTDNRNRWLNTTFNPHDHSQSLRGRREGYNSRCYQETQEMQLEQAKVDLAKRVGHRNATIYSYIKNYTIPEQDTIIITFGLEQYGGTGVKNIVKRYDAFIEDIYDMMKEKGYESPNRDPN